jgi:hypothetical protein
MAMASRARSLLHLAYPIAAVTLACLAPASARADFFDDMRRAFQTDIPRFFETDVPHFFQDDIPCAFGGQPTSHTKTSCKAPSRPAKRAPDKERDGAAAPSDSDKDETK